MLRNCRSALVALGIVSLLGVRSSHATTIALTETQDRRIIDSLNAQGQTVYGGDSGALSVYNSGEGQPAGANVQHSLVLFDLSSIPADATISSATLTLTHDSAIYPTGQPAGTQTNVYALSESFTTAATYDTRDGSKLWTTLGGTNTGTLYSSNNTAIPANSGMVDVPFDVTSLVSAWTSGALVNDGALLIGTQGDGLHFVASGTGAPSLSVTYTAAPEPTSLGMIALAGVTLIARRRRA